MPGLGSRYDKRAMYHVFHFICLFLYFVYLYNIYFIMSLDTITLLSLCFSLFFKGIIYMQEKNSQIISVSVGGPLNC